MSTGIWEGGGGKQRKVDAENILLQSLPRSPTGTGSLHLQHKGDVGVDHFLAE